MDKIGIELKLTQNIEQQLKTIQPMLEKMDKQFHTINQTLIKMQDLHNKATQGFNKMASSIDNVSRKEQGLRNVNTHISNMGKSATTATSLMGNLSRSIGSVVAAAGPLFGLYKILQGITAGVGAGVDFQSSVIALQRKGFSASEVSSIRDYALSSSASGKTVLTPGQQIESAAGALPILGHANVRAAMPEYNRMATMFKGAKVDLQSPEVISRFWELAGVKRDPKSIQKLDNALYRVSVASGIPLSQLLYQYNMYGAGAIGRDFEQSLTETAYFAKESGAGLAGAGGGRGRAGNIARAMDSMISGGKISQATIQMMYNQGRFPGLDKYIKGHAGGRGLLYNDANGQIINAHSGGRTVTDTAHITTTAFKEYLAKERGVNPGLKWMEAAGASDDVAVREFTIMAARSIGLTGSPMDMIDKFHKLPGVRQKQAFSNFIGSNILTNTGIMQYGGVGQYQTNVKNFKDAVSGVPLPDADAPQSLEQKFAEFTAQFDSFMTKFINTPQIMGNLNNAMNGLIDIMQQLNGNVQPIAQYVNSLLPHNTEQASGLAGGVALGAGVAGAPGAIAGGIIGQQTGRLSHNVLRAVDKLRSSPQGQWLYEQGQKYFAPARYGKGVKYGGFILPPGESQSPTGFSLTPPPPPPQIGGSMIDRSMDKQYAKQLGMPLVTPAMLSPHNTVHVTVNHETKLDSKTIAKHTTEHVSKALVKSAHTMHRAASSAGGSRTSSVLNSGGNADQ